MQERGRKLVKVGGAGLEEDSTSCVLGGADVRMAEDADPVLLGLSCCHFCHHWPRPHLQTVSSPETELANCWKMPGNWAE